MKLFKVKTIQEIETQDIASSPMRACQLMYTAATLYCKWILEYITQEQGVLLLCGNGNNGADGLLIAELLSNKGFDVKIFSNPSDHKGSSLFKVHLSRITNSKSIPVYSFDQVETHINAQSIIIDALLGIGLNRELAGTYKDIVELINSCQSKVYSVDIPTGLLADNPITKYAIRAYRTLSFQLPKLSFFHKEAQAYLGNWAFVDIGFNHELLNSYDCNQYLITKSLIQKYWKKRKKFSHKGTYGKVSIIAGSIGMAGAGILCARGALHSGVGLIQIFGVESQRDIFQTTIPEAIFLLISDVNHTGRKSTNVLGPGIDNDAAYLDAMRYIINESIDPIVLDAGAINLIANEKNLIAAIPNKSVLTPHPKEFERLAGKFDHTFDRLKKQLAFSIRTNTIVILKDHYTTITTPDGHTYYNMTGNAGLATGGSGDVLAGIVSSFIAQGYDPTIASIISVYIHGRSADYHASIKDQLSLTPSGLINHLSDIIKDLELR